MVSLGMNAEVILALLLTMSASSWPETGLPENSVRQWVSQALSKSQLTLCGCLLSQRDLGVLSGHVDKAKHGYSKKKHMRDNVLLEI